jgi:DNA-binding beta-propeller fold protein YncE
MDTARLSVRKNCPEADRHLTGASGRAGTGSGVRRRNARPALVGALAAFTFAGLVGCAAPPERVEQERLVWPAPPETTRIKFLRSVVSEDDLGRDTTFSHDVLNLLAGVDPPPTRIAEPMGIAVSDDGQRLYVSNFGRRAVFRFDFAQQTFTPIEPLAHPVGVALDADEHLYVVEQARKAITVFDREGNQVRSITHPDIERPSGIAIDRARGRIYLVDTGRSELRSETKKGHNVKVFSLDGELLTTIGRGRGDRSGEMMFPTYAAVDRSGNLYVTDTLNSRVQVFDSAGNFVKKFGERGNAWGMFDKPKGVALDSFGNVYVADSGWSNIQMFNQKGEILMFFGGRGPLPGMLKNPTAVVIDPNDRIYVADFINHRINMYQLVNTTAEDSFLNPLAGAETPEEAARRADAQKIPQPIEGGS